MNKEYLSTHCPYCGSRIYRNSHGYQCEHCNFHVKNYICNRHFNKEEIELTTKEYELLIYFVKNKGIAISREQVLAKVWDENYFGSDRVVDDTLRRLRKKMPDLNIKTIYGFGYRLD